MSTYRINWPRLFGFRESSASNRSDRLHGGHFLRRIAVNLLLVTGLQWSASAYTMKQAPIMTQWASQVNPANPLPDYPRPQLVRTDWMNLNGVWQFQTTTASSSVPVGQNLTGDILVPFPVESAISGVMQTKTPYVWYRRTFTIPTAWAGKRTILNFGAVDYQATVYINGQSVGSHKGGYDPFSFDITPQLTASGAQEIIVGVYDPTNDGGQPRGKQSNSPNGIMYTSTTGIWQTVWLEPVSTVRAQDIKMVPNIDNNTLQLTVNTNGATATVNGTVTDPSTGATVQTFSGTANAALNIAVPNAKYWSPDNPFLYNLNLSVTSGGVVTDQVASYFAMRKISLGTVNGLKKIYLNNRFVFQMGVLEQGFWPDGIYTAPTEAAMKNDLQTVKNLGFNMVRKHIKVEPDRYYYWTDKLGLLVWQDMPSADSYDYAPLPVDTTEFESELVRMVQTHWNHPSIVLWTVFNEAQGQFDTARLVSVVQSTDPSRLVNEASGGAYFGSGNVHDEHAYPQPSQKTPSSTQASAAGEFGGIAYYVQGHTWKTSTSRYDVNSGPELISLYAQYIDFVKSARAKGMSGAVYTQLSDVEMELNGLMTYDRLLKEDANSIALANRLHFITSDLIEVVPTSEVSGQPWKYNITTTATPPASNWNQAAYNDSAWSQGNGGFGTPINSAQHIGTTWNTSDIWLRKSFNPGAITASEIQSLVVREFHDNDVDVYINGVLAFTDGGFITNYESRYLYQAAKNTVVPNASNLLAIHCHQAGGGQYIDAGLYIEEPITPAFSDNFDSGSAGSWTPYGGTWSAAGGQYSVNPGAGPKSVVTGSNVGDFIYEADVKINGGDAGLIFRTMDPAVGADAYFGYYVGLHSNAVVLGKAADNWTQLASTPATIAANTWQHLRVVNIGSSINVYLNDMTSPQISLADADNASGGIGVRGFNSTCAFDNVAMGSLKYASDFASGAATGWSTYGGTWTVNAGQYTVPSNGDVKALLDDNSFGDLTLDADVAFNGGEAGVLFRASNPAVGTNALSGYYAGISSVKVTFGKMDNGWTGLSTISATLAANVLHHMKVVCTGTNIKVFVDSMAAPVINVNDSRFSSGQIGLRTFGSAGVFDNVFVY